MVRQHTSCHILWSADSRRSWLPVKHQQWLPHRRATPPALFISHSEHSELVRLCRSSFCEAAAAAGLQCLLLKQHEQQQLCHKMWCCSLVFEVFTPPLAQQF